MYAKSAEEFNAGMDFLRSLVGDHSDLMQYIKETWLPFKHKFVKYAIDRYMHMSNTTTNRVEGAHAKLKACIKDSKSDICAAWAAIHRCTLLQHTRINAAFQASIFIREHTFKEMLYDNLRGVVSRYVLMLIAKEKARVGKCGCTIRRTHGLPCSCPIGMMASIPLTAVGQHWRRLTSTAAPDESQPVFGLSIATELKVIAKMFEEANVPRRQAIKERLREIAYPDQTSMCPPLNKLPTRGWPGEAKGSTRRIPSSWENADAIVGSKQGSNSSAPQGKGKGRKTRSAKQKSITPKQSAPRKRSKRISSNSTHLPPPHSKAKVYSVQCNIRQSTRLYVYSLSTTTTG